MMDIARPDFPCEACFIISSFAELESRLCQVATLLVHGVRGVHAQQDPLNRHILPLMRPRYTSYS